MFMNDNPTPVNEILGPRTRWILNAPDRVESMILQRNQELCRSSLKDYRVLARGPELTKTQIASLQVMVFEPLSFYDGMPLFRRFPSAPNFAFRLQREETTLELLVELLNPGWEFYCENEFHMGWHWVDREMARLAKALFPEYASESSSSMWRRGAIKKLAETKN